MRKLEYMTEPELRTAMNAIGHAIEHEARLQGIEKPMFTLLLWNDPKLGQYMSNCRREQMIEALKETVEQLSKNQDIPR